MNSRQMRYHFFGFGVALILSMGVFAQTASVKDLLKELNAQYETLEKLAAMGQVAEEAFAPLLASIEAQIARIESHPDVRASDRQDAEDVLLYSLSIGSDTSHEKYLPRLKELSESIAETEAAGSPRAALSAAIVLQHELKRASSDDVLTAIADYQKRFANPNIPYAGTLARILVEEAIRTKPVSEALEVLAEVRKLFPNDADFKATEVRLGFIGNPLALSGPVFDPKKFLEWEKENASKPEDERPAYESGVQFDLADLKGNVIIVDFFASWCKPCHELAPKLAGLLKKYEAKGVKAVAFAADEEEKLGGLAEYLIDFEKFVTEKKLINWPTVHVPGPRRARLLQRNYAIRSYPSVWVVGADGNVVAVDLGTAEEVESSIRKALGE